MILPNFLIIGAQKSGTTSLHDILDAHPEVLMSSQKEINFFTYKHKYEKGLNYYSTFFKTKGINNKPIAIGESSPGYLCYPKVYKKIFQSLGKIKIVVILRNPIKRAFSQYWDNRRQLNEQLTEQEIVENYLDTMYRPGKKGYFSRGVYYNDVKKYIEWFGKDNVHVIIFENLLNNQKKELQKLYSFLNITKDKGLQELPLASNTSIIYNNPFYKFYFKNPNNLRFLPKKLKPLLLFGTVEKYKYSLPDQDILSILEEFYKPWNKKLENLLAIDLSIWSAPTFHNTSQQ